VRRKPSKRHSDPPPDANAYARHHGLEATFHLAVEDQRHVGGGSAHVEADGAREAGLGRHVRRAHDTAGRPGQQGPRPPEAGRVGQPPRRLHEAQPRPGQRGLQLGGVAAQQRRQVGICGRGLAAGQQADFACHLVGGHHVGQALLPGDLGDARLDVRVCIRVDQRDSHGANAAVPGVAQRRAQRVGVQHIHTLAVHAHAPAHLDHPLVQRLRLLDAQGEKLGSLLGADARHVAQAAIGDQQRALAAALEQRVGGDGAPPGRDGSVALEDGSNALHRGRVRRQDLGRLQRAVGRKADAVGEGATAIDPELPLARLRSPAAHCAPTCGGLALDFARLRLTARPPAGSPLGFTPPGRREADAGSGPGRCRPAAPDAD
jgi:hypothetical protein